MFVYQFAIVFFQSVHTAPLYWLTARSSPACGPQPLTDLGNLVLMAFHFFCRPGCDLFHLAAAHKMHRVDPQKKGFNMKNTNFKKK